MKRLKDAKEFYEAVTPPDELDALVRHAVRRGRTGEGKIRAVASAGRMALAAAACLCLAFVAVVNAVPVFAQGLYDIPVLGNVARVFTFRQYEQADEDGLLSVRMPALENTGNTELENRINQEIRVRLNREIQSAKQWAREYQQAFLDTGGKPEEYIPMELRLDYTLHCNNENIVSFHISKSQTSASYYEERFYYNIDLASGKELTLADLLGEECLRRVDEEIKRQIGQRDPEGDIYYHDELEFESIAPGQEFYVNEREQVVIVFPKYAIGPGYLGIQEFEIPTDPVE